MTDHVLDYVRRGKVPVTEQRGRESVTHANGDTPLDDDLRERLAPFVWLDSLWSGKFVLWEQDLYRTARDFAATIQAQRVLLNAQPERTSAVAGLLREAGELLSLMAMEWQSTLQILDETPLDEMDNAIKSIQQTDIRYIRQAREWLRRAGLEAGDE